MSVINAIKVGTKGYLYTDTAHLDTRNGNLAVTGSKAFRAAKWPAVVGATISGGFIPPLIDFFVEGPPKSVAALQLMLPDACRRFVEVYKQSGAPDPVCRLVAVAWCEHTQSIRLFHCASVFSGPLGEAYNPVEITYFLGAGAGHPRYEQATAALASGLPFDPDQGMIELMEEQRRAPFISQSDPQLNGMHCIGGAIERLTVTPDQVLGETLRKWPDKVGEPIRPRNPRSAVNP